MEGGQPSSSWMETTSETDVISEYKSTSVQFSDIIQCDGADTSYESSQHNTMNRIPVVTSVARASDQRIPIANRVLRPIVTSNRINNSSTLPVIAVALLRLLLNVTTVTTGHQKLPQIGQNSIKSSFFAQRAKKPRPKAKALRRSLKYASVAGRIFQCF